MKSVLIFCLGLTIASVFAAEDSIVVQEIKEEGDGKFHVRVETGSGSKIVQEGHLSGAKEGEAIDGQYIFQDKEGKTHEIDYTADERGYQPRGEDIPTPPPIPEAIQRSLDYIASHPAYVQANKPNKPNKS